MAPPRIKSTRTRATSGMSPMESQARYGSIAGGGLKADTVSSFVNQINNLRQAQGQEPSYTAQDLLADKTATEMKYGREARLNESLFGDDSGRTITPSMLDSRGNIMAFTAAPPTFRQLLGDASRAFTGGTAFTRAAGLPDPSDQTGILSALPKMSPMLNLLGFNPEKKAVGPTNLAMAQDYVGGQGMFAPDRSMTPTTPSREELLSRVGIESIPDATDSPAFKDLTPQEILETPLESFAEIEQAFKQGALIDDILREDYMSPTGGQGSRDYLEMTTTPFYKKYQELYEQYPDLYKSIFPQGRVILNPA